MKVKVTIFCLVLGAVLKFNTAEELPTGCPADEDPRYPTHLPHTTDCTKFWKCNNGVPNLNYCEGGLHWSIENAWCDYPENAKCVRPLPEDGGESSGEDGGESGGEDGGETDLPTGCPPDEDPRYPTHLPHATDCDKFWKCWSGVPNLNECPQGQHWSIENTWCDYIENVQCIRPIPEDGGENGGSGNGGEDGSEEGETDLPTGCPPDEDPRYPTHLPHATDCDKFWKCWSGVPNLNECPQGQHWSIENTWCDYIENVQCIRPIPEDGGENGGSGNGGEDGSEEGETDLPTGCPPDEDPRYPTHLPHATDCDKFWKCWSGVPNLNECPQGQHWSIENTWCDYIENVQCIRPIPEDGGGSGNGGEDSEETPPAECPGETDPSGPSHFPHDTDCTKFWQCVGGIAYLVDCPSGLHWNHERQYCDYASNANCAY